MRLRKIIQDYFTFSKKERNGIIVLMVVVFLMAIANKVIFLFEKPDELEVEKFLAEVAEFKEEQLLDLKFGSLFKFDPNIIDSLALDSLLIPSQVKRNIMKFRMRGGHFYYADDVRKIYGMNDSIFSSIRDFISIQDKKEKKAIGRTTANDVQFFVFDPNDMSDVDWERLGLTKNQIQRMNRYKQSLGGQFISKEQFKKVYGIDSVLMDSLLKYIKIESKIYEPKLQKPVKTKLIELNSADTVILKSLPGIGSILSRRIVKYRELLGGFYSAKQLAEVYGIKPEVLLKIESLFVVDTMMIQKIDINFSSMDELARHPYIDKKLAREIVDFRSKNGKINELTVLIQKKIINEEQYQKMRVYLGTKNN